MAYSSVVRRLSTVVGALAVAALALTATLSPAEAARKKRGGGYNPPYAAIVIDAKTGRMLHGVNENALRHPASITKVMTLYMLFEQMERGRFRMDTPLRVSSFAAARPPSKIGFDPGETIEVEDAIKALITKSANDVAVTVAENIAGSESVFAEQMTRRARQLGMSRTTFKNASGLPDPEQVTTARDLTILARAIQERFPRHYHLFQTRNFEFAGRNYRNHNKLLGRVEGVDGIKTGFTRASGFNLMTSAKADGRQIISIVLGGRSGRIRDNIMAGLVVAHLPRASTGPRSTLVAQLPDNDDDDETSTRENRQPTRGERVRVAAAPAPGQAAPRQQVVARETVIEAPAAAAAVTVAARPVARPLELAAARPLTASAAAVAFAPPTPTSTSAQAMRWATGAPPAGAREIRPPANVAQAAPSRIETPRTPAQGIAQVAPPVAQPVRPPATVTAAAPTPVRTLPSVPPQARSDGPRPPANVQFTSSVAKAPEKPAVTIESGWMIQLGATDDESKAKGILSNARTKSRALADARGFTQTVERGGATLFRARFAGFDDQSEANNVCRDLKRSGFSCFATRT